MNRRGTTVLFGSAVIGIILMLAVYMGLIVTGVIDTRPSALIVVAGSAQKEYDGEPLECHEYTLKSGELKKGHRLQVTFDAKQTDAGSTENVAEVKVLDSLGADVTNHYKIETRPGKLTVTPRKLVLRSGNMHKVYDGTPLIYEDWSVAVGEIPETLSANVTFTGSQTEPGTSKNAFSISIENKRGEAVDRNFSISYLYGVLTVTKRSLTVTSYGASKVYDAEPLRYEFYTVDGEVLGEHYLDVEFPASITDVGSVTNNITVQIRSIYTDEVQDLSDYYDITVRVGTLEVTPRPIEITASPCIKNFVGNDLPEGQWYLTKGSLAANHTVSAEVQAVKNEKNTVEFLLRDVHVFDQGYLPDVSHNYEITLVHGIDRDQSEALSLVSGSQSAPYTGQPLTCEQYMLVSGTLEEGHVIEPLFTGSQTEVGFSDNTFSVAIIDTVTGEDVTYRYSLSYEYGVLEVYENTPATGGEISDDGSLDNDVQNQDAVAARVWAQSSTKLYLRWKSYGDYSYREGAGNWGWGEALAYPFATENMLYSTGMALKASGKSAVAYDIELFGNQYLLPNYVAQGPEGAYNDVVIAPYAQAYTMLGYQWNYSYAESLQYAEQGSANEQLAAYEEFVYAQYLDVPESTRAVLEEIAAQNGLSADKRSVIEDVASFVSSAAKYHLDYPECPAGMDEVVYFLVESKSGVCRHFASAATLLYRTMGIPARYVVGYSTFASEDCWTEIKGADAHAWVEVFITGIGWVRIDPTPAISSSIDEDTLVLALEKVKGYYTGMAYVATKDHVIIAQGELQQGHELVDLIVEGEQTDVGESRSAIVNYRIVDSEGNDVTDQYTIVLQDGLIEVKAPTLEIFAASAKKEYDGTPLTAPTFSYRFKNTELGPLYTVTATVEGLQDEVGEGSNLVKDVRVTTPAGEDITHNFIIAPVNGTLKVYLYVLEISTPSARKTYDGHVLSAATLSYDRDALDSRGHWLEYSMPSITDVGAKRNEPTCRVLDQNGEDVSLQYDIRISAGTLIIDPVELTIETASASKVYDGKPLYVDDFTLTEGQLVTGHEIVTYQISGSQTNVGVSEAMVTAICILNADGKDVTANYYIIIEPGKLTVLAP